MSPHDRDAAIRVAEAASSARPAEAIVGDWTGEADRPQAGAVADLADLRRRVRGIYAEVMRRRAYWALRPSEIDAARAVAYQSIGGLLQRVVESNENREAAS